MTEYAVQYYIKDHVAYITFTCPALDEEISQTVKDICISINGNEEVYVVVISGSGDNFCKAGEKTVEGTAKSVAAIDRPVIAAINGEAVGLGLEIALAADIRIAADKAVFGLPEVAEGQMPADGGTQRLPRIIGRGKALELLLTGDTVNSSQALEIGLVSKVVPAAELEDEARKLAQTIAAKGPIALRYLKEAIIKGMDMTLEQGLRLEADLYFLHTTSDRTEGIKAFLEKRPPKYEGK